MKGEGLIWSGLDGKGRHMRLDDRRGVFLISHETDDGGCRFLGFLCSVRKMDGTVPLGKGQEPPLSPFARGTKLCFPLLFKEGSPA